MKDLGSDEVYYGVAALTVIILLVYIHAGEVIPLVGFLLSGSLVYALYPNKSVALVAGVIIASLLQMTKREGFEGDPPAQESPESKPVQESQGPAPSSPPSGADTAGVLPVTAPAPAAPAAPPVADAGVLTDPVQPSVMSSGANTASSLDESSNSATTTSSPAAAAPPPPPPPAEAASSRANAETQRRQRQAERLARRQAKQARKATEGLTDLDPSDLTSTDMDQLSSLIDKTTDLLKMLPDGFLAKASI
jgi:hypothetical protein